MPTSTAAVPARLHRHELPRTVTDDEQDHHVLGPLVGVLLHSVARCWIGEYADELHHRNQCTACAAPANCTLLGCTVAPIPRRPTRRRLAKDAAAMGGCLHRCAAVLHAGG